MSSIREPLRPVGIGGGPLSATPGEPPRIWAGQGGRVRGRDPARRPRRGSPPPATPGDPSVLDLGEAHCGRLPSAGLWADAEDGTRPHPRPRAPRHHRRRRPSQVLPIPSLRLERREAPGYRSVQSVDYYWAVLLQVEKVYAAIREQEAKTGVQTKALWLADLGSAPSRCSIYDTVIG